MSIFCDVVFSKILFYPRVIQISYDIQGLSIVWTLALCFLSICIDSFDLTHFKSLIADTCFNIFTLLVHFYFVLSTSSIRWRSDYFSMKRIENNWTKKTKNNIAFILRMRITKTIYIHHMLASFDIQLRSVFFHSLYLSLVLCWTIIVGKYIRLPGDCI